MTFPPPQKERRRYSRIPLEIWVREETGEYFYSWKTKDISWGGFFLERKITGSRKELSTFFFSLPTSRHRIVVKGRVIYCSTKGKVGTGIRFEKLSSHDKKILRSFIGSLEKGFA